ncbi:MAG: hypothetical protein LBK73_06515 [Treponema sp.]|jgi:hypothetical protein|nr:hypothetical protein [Treponema sp.]
MKKKLFMMGMLAMVLAFGLVLAGCDDLATALTTQDENGNRPLDYMKTYAFYNSSSYTVHLWDDTGDYYLSAGDSCTGNFNAEISINEVYYTPSNTVNVTKTGSTSFTFTNK